MLAGPKSVTDIVGEGRVQSNPLFGQVEAYKLGQDTYEAHMQLI